MSITAMLAEARFGTNSACCTSMPVSAPTAVPSDALRASATRDDLASDDMEPPVGCGPCHLRCTPAAPLARRRRNLRTGPPRPAAPHLAPRRRSVSWLAGRCLGSSLPSCPVASADARLAAHSCGGSHGFGHDRPHRVPVGSSRTIVTKVWCTPQAGRCASELRGRAGGLSRGRAGRRPWWRRAGRSGSHPRWSPAGRCRSSRRPATDWHSASWRPAGAPPRPASGRRSPASP